MEIEGRGGEKGGEERRGEVVLNEVVMARWTPPCCSFGRPRGRTEVQRTKETPGRVRLATTIMHHFAGQEWRRLEITIQTCFRRIWPVSVHLSGGCRETP